jgi:hypothetical protein
MNGIKKFFKLFIHFNIYNKYNKMAQNLDLIKDPYGLGTGILLSGSISIPTSGSFCYYPLLESVANIKTANIVSASNGISGTWTPGIPLYAHITEVTQSSGYAILYDSRFNSW